MQRIICIWLPFLESERLIRRKAEMAGKPFVLITREAGRVFLSAVNRQAGKLGFAQGMSLVDVRAAMPDIPYFEADPAGDLRCLRGLMRMMSRFSPRVARADEGSDLYLDTAGASHLFGGERAMLHKIEAQLQAAGFTVRLALAGTRAAAWGFAHYGKNGRIIAASDLQGQAEGLPVEALRMSDGSNTLCRRLGLKKVGELLALPRSAVAARIGLQDLARVDLFLGRSRGAEQFARHRERLAETRQFPDPLATTAGVEAALEALLDKLCARLAPFRQGIRKACLTLDRVDHESMNFTIRMMQPGLETDAMKRLFAHHFEQLNVGFGIDRMTLTAKAVAPLEARQPGLEESRQQAGERALEKLVTELSNMFGAEHIVKFSSAESHIPERAFQEHPALYPVLVHGWPDARARRPLRLLKKPQSILEEAVVPGLSVPERIFWRGKECHLTPLTGPERIAPDWWRNDPLWQDGARDYWWVKTHFGAVLWLYRVTEDKKSRWFLHGMGS